MTLDSNARRWLSCSAALLFAVTPLSWAQEEQTSEETAQEQAPAAPEPHILEAMGYAMAQSLRLNIGFSEEELDQIFAGMRALASGEEPPAAMGESVQQAQNYYLQKLEVARQKEEAEREVIAARNKEATEAFFAELDERDNVQKTESGLYYEVLEEGVGDAVTVGKSVTLNYTGTLPDGGEFDSGQGASFPVQESGGLIEGFREGLLLAKVGSHLRLYIPPDLGYGNAPPPNSPIEPGQPLIFDVEVLGVQEVRRNTMRPAGPPPGGRPNARPPSGPPPGLPPGPPPNVTPPPPPRGTPPPPPAGSPSN